MSQSYCLVTCCSVANGSWREDWTVIWSHINRKQMTSINLQFMLFFKPLSVHSCSIMWRPDEREKRRGKRGGRQRKRELLHDKVYFSSTRWCHRVRLIVLYWTNKIVALSLSLYCDMMCIYFLLFLLHGGFFFFFLNHTDCVSPYRECYPFADEHEVHPQLCGCLFFNLIGVIISSDKGRRLLYDMLWHPATNVEEHHLPLPSGVNYCWRKLSTIDLQLHELFKILC